MRLLPPGQTPGSLGLPTSLPPRDTDGRAANSGILTQPQQSAYRERAVPSAPAPTPRKSPAQESTNVTPISDEPAHTQNTASSLARTPVVRENTTSDIAAPVDATTHTFGTAMEEESYETRQEVLEQKAKIDPVVQEVIRMFKANIKEVGPKHQ